MHERVGERFNESMHDFRTHPCGKKDPDGCGDRGGVHSGSGVGSVPASTGLWPRRPLDSLFAEGPNGTCAREERPLRGSVPGNTTVNEWGFRHDLHRTSEVVNGGDIVKQANQTMGGIG